MKRICLIFLILCSAVFAQSNIIEDSIHFVGQASAFTVGANLVSNGDFESAGGGGTAIFTGWVNTLIEDDGGGDDYEVQDVDNGQFHDGTTGTTHACNIWSEAGDYIDIAQNGILTAGKTYRMTLDVLVNAGAIRVLSGAGYHVVIVTSGTKSFMFQADGTDIKISRSTGATDITIDNIEVVEWVGNPDAAGGCTIASFTGDLLDYMTATGGTLDTSTGLATENNGDDEVRIDKVADWVKNPVVGGFVNIDFSAALNSGQDDGIYKIIAATDTTIDIFADFTDGPDDAITVDIWVGGAFPDIATAINDSTVSEDSFSVGIYRKRYICVNVDQKVDAVTDFVAETSETALREDDGSRKIIGFYDSISVVSLKAGTFNVVSDMDFGQTYYAGARRAFNLDESFTEINPNGKWIEWDAQGNDINILEMNTSNFEMRNIKIHNTAIGGTNALLHVDDATINNAAFVNCWFATADLLQVNTIVRIDQSVFQDCYFDNSIVSNEQSDIRETAFINCITNGTGRGWAASGSTNRSWYNCLFYKGIQGVRLHAGGVVSNCVFFDQTAEGINFINGSSRGDVFNSIFSPVAASDQAFNMDAGSLNAASRNNIMYSVTAGAVLTNPIVHDRITPNPPLPVGTLEVDPLFVDPANGDFRLQAASPARNAGINDIFSGKSTIGIWQPGGGGYGPGIGSGIGR